MVVDRYTKVVLTVIAVALAALAATQVLAIFSPAPVIAKAGAGGPGVTKVVVCNEKGDYCASVDETGRLFVK